VEIRSDLKRTAFLSRRVPL